VSVGWLTHSCVLDLTERSIVCLQGHSNGTMLRADSFFSFAVVVLQFRMTGGTHYVVLLVGCSGLILRTPSIRLCVLSERDKGARPVYSLQYF